MSDSRNGLVKPLKVKDLIATYGVSLRHIQEEIKRKNLRAFKPGKELQFLPEDVEKWFKRKAV